MDKPAERADTTLKFARKFRQPILDGEKTATVRYDDEKNISEGDLLKFKDADGPFARARVTNVIHASVLTMPSIIDGLPDAQHGTDDWKELHTNLNHHYDDEIHATETVKLIVFEIES